MANSFCWRLLHHWLQLRGHYFDSHHPLFHLGLSASSSSTKHFNLHTTSLVKPLATVQPESCSLGSVNWCWSGISSQIPWAQYSCCDSCLRFALRSSCESRSNSPAPVLLWDRLLGPLMRCSCLIVTLCVLSFARIHSCLATSLMSSCLYKGVVALVLVSAGFTSQSHEQDPNWRCFFYSCSCQVSQPLLE